MGLDTTKNLLHSLLAFIVYSYIALLNCSTLLWESNSDHSFTEKNIFLAESRRMLTVNNLVLCCAS